MSKYINADEIPSLFNEEYKRTRKLIEQGETHLDNLAEGFLEAEQVISRMPSADVVEIKHGHWELDGTCSICGKHTLQSYGNFCCYCGADMRDKTYGERKTEDDR